MTEPIRESTLFAIKNGVYQNMLKYPKHSIKDEKGIHVWQQLVREWWDEEKRMEALLKEDLKLEAEYRLKMVLSDTQFHSIYKHITKYDVSMNDNLKDLYYKFDDLIDLLVILKSNDFKISEDILLRKDNLLKQCLGKFQEIEKDFKENAFEQYIESSSSHEQVILVNDVASTDYVVARIREELSDEVPAKEIEKSEKDEMFNKGRE